MPRLPLVLVLAALGLTASTALAGGYSGGTPAAPQRGFVHYWDANGDGTVSFREIRRVAPIVFERFDVNRDGVLSGRETTAFDSARQTDIRRVGGRYGNEVARMAGGVRMARADIDGNGHVTLDEFRLAATGWLAMLDRNGSGYLTDYDFTRSR